MDHIPRPYNLNSQKRNYFYDVDISKDFELNLSPVEGDVDVYVNPGFYTDVLNKIQYHISTRANKRLIISKEELYEMALTNKVKFLYLKF